MTTNDQARPRRKQQRSRLGRGLDALIGGPEPGAHDLPPADAAREIEMDLDRVRPGRYQPRARVDEESLKALAASIGSQGVIQPILVRETASGRYEILAGERRWRAARMAGLETVPVIVRQVSDEAALAVALIENIQREDLNPIEEAAACKRLVEEFGLTHQQVADRIGRSRTAVTNLLRLLTLDGAAREHLEAGRIEMGHARALLSLPRERQAGACETVVQRDLSVRATEELVRRLLSSATQDKTARSDAGRGAAAKSADVRNLERELCELLGAQVVIDHGKKRGRVIIEYHDLDELDGILQKIR